MKKGLIVFLSAILVFVLAACGGDKKENTEETTQFEVPEDERVGEDEVVAVVNGEEVKGAVYNLVYTQLALHAHQMQKETENDELKEAALTSVIDRQIVLQEAKKKDIEVTDKEAEEHLKKLKEESGDELETLLQQYQISESEFKDQLIFELTLNDYMVKTVDVDVTEDEIKEYYEKAKEGTEDIPPYEEIKLQLEKQLLNDKTLETFQSHIDSIKEKSDIETKI